MFVFNSNSRAPALVVGGSADFGAVETADREPVDATGPFDLVDSCGKRIGVPCSVGAARTAADPITPACIPALLPREPPPPRCALAESIVSANAARATAKTSDGLRSVLVNMMVPSDTLGELSTVPAPQSGAQRVADAPRRSRRRYRR